MVVLPPASVALVVEGRRGDGLLLRSHQVLPSKQLEQNEVPFIRNQANVFDGRIVFSHSVHIILRFARNVRLQLQPLPRAG